MRLLYFDIPRTNNHLHKISKKDHRKSYRLSAAFFVFWVTINHSKIRFSIKIFKTNFSKVDSRYTFDMYNGHQERRCLL